MQSSYSIIIPTYNEIDSLPILLHNIQKYYADGHEIIIVDDGSIDGSKEILSNCQFIKLIKLHHNQGKGIALKKGILNSTNEKIIIFDSDLELHPDQIKNLMILDSKKNIRYVIGNRYKIQNLNSLWNIGNRLLTYLFNFINNSNIKDALCCAKSFFKSDIDVKSLKSSKFDIDVEILSKLIKQNSILKTIDFEYERRDRKEGKKLKLKDSLRILFRVLMKY